MREIAKRKKSVTTCPGLPYFSHLLLSFCCPCIYFFCYNSVYCFKHFKMLRFFKRTAKEAHEISLSSIAQQKKPSICFICPRMPHRFDYSLRFFLFTSFFYSSTLAGGLKLKLIRCNAVGNTKKIVYP